MSVPDIVLWAHRLENYISPITTAQLVDFEEVL